jgi:hypothetical protein
VAESTLSLKFEDFQREVGDMLGIGRTPGIWTSEDISRVDDIIQAGYRQFLAPPPIPGTNKSHDWRFLRPITTINAFADIAVNAAVTVTGVFGGSTTDITATAPSFSASMIGKTITITSVGNFTITAFVSSTAIVVGGNATCAGATWSIASDGDYQLPDDFAGIIGDLTYEPNVTYVPIRVTGEGQIRVQRMKSANATGRPYCAAVRPKALVAGEGQRFELMLYPKPDAAYVLTYQYRANPSKISASQYPYGGMMHAETLMASIFAAAALRLDDRRTERWDYFIERLAASIRIDEDTSGDYFGYNSDMSDAFYQGQRSTYRDLHDVTYNGIAYP